jgi:AAA15 family ATPase/GTPase
MLVRFTVENFLSFNQRVDFNMLASDEIQHQHHVISCPLPQKRELLRTSLLYGANASGKSNFIKAMAFAKHFIVHGVEKHQNIDLKPFKLHENSARQPTRFEFEFCCAGRVYAYGFIVEKHRVIEEWLFDLSQIEDISIFERKEQLMGFNYKHPLFDNLSDEDKQRLDFEAKGTRGNLLFLTNCQERNIVRFNTIYQWFKETLLIIFPQSKNRPLLTLTQLNQDFFNDMLTFFDFGISRIHFEPFDFESNQEISEGEKQEIKANFPHGTDKVGFVAAEKFNYIVYEKQGVLQTAQVLAVRTDNRGHEVLFELFEESDGTHRLIDLIPILMMLYQDNAVVVIDELERSLHALLSRKLFELFLNHPLFTQSRSQLIATTHEVTLLDIKQLVRKDEIWFTEKDEMQQSIIYSLAGADVDKLNLVNSYLNGRFGAIPLIGEVKILRSKI